MLVYNPIISLKESYLNFLQIIFYFESNGKGKEVKLSDISGQTIFTKHLFPLSPLSVHTAQIQISSNLWERRTL